MRLEIKSDRTEYYKYYMVYVDNVLVIIYVHIKTIEEIKCVFKLKVDKKRLPTCT